VNNWKYKVGANRTCEPIPILLDTPKRTVKYLPTVNVETHHHLSLKVKMAQWKIITAQKVPEVNKISYLASVKPKWFSSTPLWASTLGHGFLTYNHCKIPNAFSIKSPFSLIRRNHRILMILKKNISIQQIACKSKLYFSRKKRRKKSLQLLIGETWQRHRNIDGEGKIGA
jgi:hypothetical protein